MRVAALLALARAATPLSITSCTGAPTQQGALSAVGAPSLVRDADGRCLTTVDCAPAAGGGVAARPCGAGSACAGGADQLWTLAAAGGGGTLTSAASGGALALTLANTDGPGVNLWAARGAAANGQWAWDGAPGGAPGALRSREPAVAARACLDAGGGAGSVAVLNASARGLPLYGIGGLAAIGGARLIFDYPPAQQADILDLLFAPSGGSAFQVLKTEIEGDMDSSYGSGSSFWHARAQAPDFTRGIYLPWLLREARARNPAVGTYALAWGAPGWVGEGEAGNDPLLGPDSLAYRMRYFEGVRQEYNLTFDLVGVHNERAWSKEFVKGLRAALDAAGMGATRIAVGDGTINGCADCTGSDKTITGAAAADAEFAAALGVIGLHGGDVMPALPPAYAWEAAGKVYIESESNTVDGSFATLGGEFPQWAPNAASQYGPGLAWPRQFLMSYITGRATGTIICPLSHAWTWLYGRHNHGTALFMRPWDGSYVLGSAFWTQAHFTQATRPGWNFLDGSASGAWDDVSPGWLAYATLASPALDAFSTIAVNVDDNATAPLAFRLVGALAAAFNGTTLAAWTSNASALFVRGADVPIAADGTFAFPLPPRTALTLTTLRSLRKAAPPVPPRAPFPLPYASAFAAQPRNTPGRYLSDLFGAFEVGADPLGARGGVLRQAALGAPRAWLGAADGAPFTSLPAPGTAYANGAFAADALVLAADAPAPGGEGASVSVCGRVPIWQPANFRRGTDRPGVCLTLNVSSGAWALAEVGLDGSRAVLAAGALGAPATGAWHRLALAFSDDTASAAIDGAPVAAVPAGVLRVAAGGWGLGSGAHTAAFDAVALAPAPGHAPAPGSWLYDLLPGEDLRANFTGWAGFELDLRAPGSAALRVGALGRFRARGNARAHALTVFDAVSGAAVPGANATVDFGACVSDLLGFCYGALAAPVTLAPGGRYYVVSREAAGGDAFVAMSDAAAATTHAHRDGTTLMSYAGPGAGAVAGKVSRADGGAAWAAEGDVECMYGPLNLLLAE